MKFKHKNDLIYNNNKLVRITCKITIELFNFYKI